MAMEDLGCWTREKMSKMIDLQDDLGWLAHLCSGFSSLAFLFYGLNAPGRDYGGFADGFKDVLEGDC